MRIELRALDRSRRVARPRGAGEPADVTAMLGLSAALARTVAAIVDRRSGRSRSRASPPTRPGSHQARLDPAQFEARFDSLALDRIDATLQREGLSVQALVRPRPERSIPCATSCTAKIADLEPRLAQVDAQAQAARAAAGARTRRPRRQALAAERARLNREYGMLEARLEAGAPAGCARRPARRRRSPSAGAPLYARQLFEQTPERAVADVWLDAAHALGEELGELGRMLRSWWVVAAHRRAVSHVACWRLLTLAGARRRAMAMLWRWLRRRIAVPATRPRASAKALAVDRRHSCVSLLTAPLVTLAAIEVLGALPAVAGSLIEIAYGLGMAVAIAAFGRADCQRRARARRAGAPPRSRSTMRRRHVLTRAWSGARARWALLVLSCWSCTRCWTRRRCSSSPPTCVRAGDLRRCLAQLLVVLVPPRAQDASEALPRALWIRAIGWLVLTVMVVALLTGYVGLRRPSWPSGCCRRSPCSACSICCSSSRTRCSSSGSAPAPRAAARSRPISASVRAGSG